jgi:integrase
MARVVRCYKLDSRTARAQLPARHAPYWMTVAEGRALGYRKGANGGAWMAKYRSKSGARAQCALGPTDDALDAESAAVLSFAAAQRKAREWFGSLDRHAGAKSTRYTVNQALDDYLAAFTGKSLVKTRHTVDSYLRPEFGTMQVADLTTERLSAFMIKLASRPAVYRANRKGERKLRPVRADAERVRKANANRILAPLKAALNRAFAMGKVADDTPWRRVKPFPKVGAARIRYFTRAEVGRLVAHAPAWFRPLVQAALLTGARWSELYRMRVRDVDLCAGAVYLTDEGIRLFTVLCRGGRADDLVFLNEHGRPLGTSHQVRPMKDTCAAAGVEHAGFHILRHTYGSTLSMAGVPMAVIAEALGHADERITRKHYGHLCPSYVRDAVRSGLGNFGIVERPRAFELVA